jgi:hypothetical protein
LIADMIGVYVAFDARTRSPLSPQHLAPAVGPLAALAAPS